MPILVTVADKKRRKKVKTRSGRTTPPASSRYTPPTPEPYKASSKIVPILMFGFFAIGVLVIILNYLPGTPLLPTDDSDPYYLLGGLGLICLGFIAATRYK